MDDSTASGCPVCGYRLLDATGDVRCPECGALCSQATQEAFEAEQRISFAARAGACVALATICFMAFAITSDGPRSDFGRSIACCGFLAFPQIVATTLLCRAAPGLSSRSQLRVMAAWAALGGAVGVFAVLAFFLSAWLGDWGRIATGSSTSGLALLVMPFYALLAGMLASILGLVIGAIVAWRNRTSVA
jgi:hypothetical protein